MNTKHRQPREHVQSYK